MLQPRADLLSTLDPRALAGGELINGRVAMLWLSAIVGEELSGQGSPAS